MIIVQEGATKTKSGYQRKALVIAVRIRKSAVSHLGRSAIPVKIL
jgi:hypothetical protein